MPGTGSQIKPMGAPVARPGTRTRVTVPGHLKQTEQCLSTASTDYIKKTLNSTRRSESGVHVTIKQTELDALVRNVEAKEGLVKKLWRFLGGAVLVIMLLFVLMFVSATIANEQTKEMHVTDGQLVSLNSNLVEVQEVESFATLFDLPYFDISTLTKIKSLTVAVDGGAREIYFTVAEIINTPGTATVRFISSNGGKITIDGKSGLAVVQMEGDKCPQTIEAGTVEKAHRKLYETGERTARLYTRDEFMQPKHGFERVDGEDKYTRRRAAADSTVAGWANVALPAAKATLDGQDFTPAITANQTWVFKGAIVSGPGGCTESGEVNFEMVYAGEDHSKFMAKETGGDGGNFQVFVWVGGGFVYDNTGGEWTRCSGLGQAGLYNEALASSSKYVVEEGGSVVKDGEGAVLRFDSVELAPEGGYTGIPTPTFAQCKEANAMKLGEAVQTGDGGVTYAIQPPAKGLQLFGGQEGQANPTDETKESSERKLGHGHGRELAAGAIDCCDVLEIEAKMVKKWISQDRFEGFAVGVTEHEGTCVLSIVADGADFEKELDAWGGSHGSAMASFNGGEAFDNINELDGCTPVVAVGYGIAGTLAEGYAAAAGIEVVTVGSPPASTYIAGVAASGGKTYVHYYDPVAVPPQQPGYWTWGGWVASGRSSGASKIRYKSDTIEESWPGSYKTDGYIDVPKIDDSESGKSQCNANLDMYYPAWTTMPGQSQGDGCTLEGRGWSIGPYTGTSNWAAEYNFYSLQTTHTNYNRHCGCG